MLSVMSPHGGRARRVTEDLLGFTNNPLHINNYKLKEKKFYHRLLLK